MNKLSLALITGASMLSLTAAAQPKTGAGAPGAPPATPAAKTVVLVHGAFADGSSWDKVVPLLEAKGLNVISVQNPLSSLADDVAATKRAIEQAPGKVILVGHSYGGMIISEAGNNDKVEALVYVAAFCPDANESITDMGKGHPAPAWTAALKVDSGGFAWLPTESVMKDFAQDLSAADQKLVAAKMGPTSVKVFDAKVAAPAWKTKPTWYIVASDDHMIDPQGEAGMAKRANATTTTIKASHVVMLSHAKEVSAVILAAVAGKPAAAPATPAKK
jgi:pimeloyl-ACP methyl ester carboxylesterase